MRLKFLQPVCKSSLQLMSGRSCVPIDSVSAGRSSVSRGGGGGGKTDRSLCTLMSYSADISV